MPFASAFPKLSIPRDAWLGLGLLLAIDLVSVFGFAVFSLHPQLLARWPWTGQIYADSYAVSARLQIGIAFLSIAHFLTRRTGGRWLPALATVFAISATAELSGVTFGLPFGKYEYTDLLGLKIAGKVPWLIPISWFFMSLPSFAIADRVTAPATGEPDGIGRRAGRIIAAAALLSAWDLTLDPAMSRLSPFWQWAETGAYFGSPLLNLFGWFVTGLGIMAAYEGLGIAAWLRGLPIAYFAVFYGLNLLLPLGLVISSGLWMPVLISATAFALVFALARGLSRVAA